MPANNEIRINITASNQAASEFKELLDQIERLQRELGKIGSASGAAARKYAEDQKTIRKQAENTNRLQVQAAKTAADAQKRADEETAREAKRLADERAATTKHRRDLEIQDERALTKEREQSAKRQTENARSLNRRAEATHRDELARGKEQRAEARRTERERQRQHMRQINQQKSLQRQLERTRRAQTRTFGQFLGRGQFRDAIGVIADASFAMQGFGLALATVGRAIVSESSRFERLNLALAAVTGSAAEARQQLEDIHRISREPLITFRDASEVAVRLRAAGFDRSETERLITEFGNAAAASGALFSDAREALRQLSQAQGLGRFTAENFNIILERLPITRGVALRQFGTLIGGDIQQTLEAQGKTFRDGVQDLIKGLEELPRVDADSFENAVSNLGNDLDILSRQIGNDLLPAITDLVNAFAWLIRFFTTDFGRIVGAAFTGALLYGGIRAGIGAVNYLRGGGLGGVAAGGLGGAAAGTGTGFFATAAGFGGVAGAGGVVPRSPSRTRLEHAQFEFDRATENRRRAQEQLNQATNDRQRQRATRRINSANEVITRWQQRLDDIQAGGSATTGGRSAPSRAGFGSRVGWNASLAAAIGVTGSRAAGIIGASAGVLAAAGPIVGFELFAQHYRDQAEAINRLADAQARIRENFNERVFGGDKGLGQVRQYTESLRTLQTTLSEILRIDSPVTGRFGPGIGRGEQNVTEFLARLNLETLSLEDARRILPQLETAADLANTLRAEDFERARELTTRIDQGVAANERLRQRLEVFAPSNVGLFGTRAFPSGPDDSRFAERFADVENVERYFEGIQNVSRAYEALEKQLEEGEDALELDRLTRGGLLVKIFGDTQDLILVRRTIDDATAEVKRLQDELDTLADPVGHSGRREISAADAARRKELEEQIARGEEIIELAKEEQINLQNRLATIEELTDESRKFGDELDRIRRIVAEADPAIRLIRAQREFSTAQFDLQRIEAPVPAQTSLRQTLAVTDRIRQEQQRVAAANNRIRDALIAVEEEEERRRDAKEKNEFLLEQRIATIREQFRQANILSEQEAAERIRAILDQLYAEIEANIQRAHDHVYGLFEEHERQRKAIETANMAIDTSVNTITESVRGFGEAARNAWNSFIFGAEAAGRRATDFLETQGQVFSALRNLGGVNVFNEQDFNQPTIRAGLRRGPNVGPGRAEFRQRQGERIQEAVRGIGGTSPDTTLTPLSDQRTREVFDPTARTRFNIPLTDEEALIPRTPPRRSQRRQDLDRFLNVLGENTYRQFGEDILLNLIGIGGRGERGLRDTLEDMRDQFREVSAEINRDSTISARERFDELARLNEDYQRQRRAVEMQYERDRERAHREFVALVISDFARLIYQQAQLRAAQKATDFIFDRAVPTLFGGGGGAGAAGAGGQAAASGAASTAGGAVGGAGGVGAAIGTGATVGVTAAGALTAAYGLKPVFEDLINSLGFHNEANDRYAFNEARRVGRDLFGGQTPQAYGQQSAQDFVDNVVSGISAGAQESNGQPVVIQLSLNDRVLQEVNVRNERMRKQGRVR